MPFETQIDLPDGVKNKLPEDAQDIYLKAFNSARETYRLPAKRQSGSREEVSHRVAWTAVKNKYHQEDGKWKHN